MKKLFALAIVLFGAALFTAAPASAQVYFRGPRVIVTVPVAPQQCYDAYYNVIPCYNYDYGYYGYYNYGYYGYYGNTWGYRNSYRYDYRGSAPRGYAPRGGNYGNYGGRGAVGGGRSGGRR
jgi:hypothetical protein